MGAVSPEDPIYRMTKQSQRCLHYDAHLLIGQSLLSEGSVVSPALFVTFSLSVPFDLKRRLFCKGEVAQTAPNLLAGGIFRADR